MEAQIVNSKMNKFDIIYLAEEHTIVNGKRIVDIRIKLGRKLAKKHKVKADVVIPIPETAIPFATGYSKESKIPFCYAIYKKRPKQKTLFIAEREKVMKDIFFVIPKLIKGKKIILIDEAVISGLSLKIVLKKVKAAKPKKIHVRVIALMPDIKTIKNPAKFFGVDSFKYLEGGQ